MEHRTLNLVLDPDFLIFTDFASLRRAVRRKSLISLICLGCGWRRGGGKERDGKGQPRFGGVAAGEGAVASRAPREKNRVPVREIAHRRAPGTPVEDVARDPDADATRATRRGGIHATVAAWMIARKRRRRPPAGRSGGIVDVFVRQTLNTRRRPSRSETRADVGRRGVRDDPRACTWGRATGGSVHAPSWLS